LSDMPQPSKYDLENLRSWLRCPGMGDFPLNGLDRGSWNPEHEKDLVTVKRRSSTDPLTRWLRETLIPAYHHVIGERYKVIRVSKLTE
jgi:hypothetical protein